MADNLVSIIIPIYKVEKYIDRCIRSVLAQTYENLEIILVDDGSPDNCPKICDKYASIDNRIIVVHKTNGGLSSARNAGMNICSGDYIAFIDSDDYVHPKFVEILLSANIRNDSDIAVCDMKKTYSAKNKTISELLVSESVLSGKECSLRYLDEDAAKYIVACNKLFSRDVIINMRFPEGKLSEDCYLIYKVLFKAYRVSIINGELYFYFQNPRGIMRSNSNMSDYNIEALISFVKFSCDRYDKSMHEEIKKKCLMKIIDYILEDYWKTFINKDRKRRKLLKNRYMRYRKILDKYGSHPILKYRCFEMGDFVYFLARGLYELKEIYNCL